MYLADDMMRDMLGGRSSSSKSGISSGYSGGGGSRNTFDSRDRGQFDLGATSSAKSNADFSFDRDRASTSSQRSLATRDGGRSSDADRLGFRSPRPNTIKEETEDIFAARNSRDSRYAGGEFDQAGNRTPKSTLWNQDEQLRSRMQNDLARSKEKDDLRKAALLDQTLDRQRGNDRYDFRADDRSESAERDRRKREELDRMLRDSASGQQNKSEWQLQKEALLRDKEELSKRLQKSPRSQFESSLFPPKATGEALTPQDLARQKLKEQFLKDSMALDKKVQKSNVPEDSLRSALRDDRSSSNSKGKEDRRTTFQDDRSAKEREDRYAFLKDDKSQASRGGGDDKFDSSRKELQLGGSRDKTSSRDDKSQKRESEFDSLRKELQLGGSKDKTSSRDDKLDSLRKELQSGGSREKSSSKDDKSLSREKDLDLLRKELQFGGAIAKEMQTTKASKEKEEPSETPQMSARELELEKQEQLRVVTSRLRRLSTPHVTVGCVPKKSESKSAAAQSTSQRRPNLVESAAMRADLHTTLERQLELDKLFAMDNCIIWNDQPVALEDLFEMRDCQRTNHFPLSRKICQKPRYFKELLTLSNMAAYKKDFAFLPGSFRMPQDSGALRKYMAELSDDKKERLLIWKALRCDEEHRERLKIFWHDNPPEKLFESPGLVQEYVANPLLFDRQKFVARHFVLISECYPNIRLFAYEDALAIFCNDGYSVPKHSKKRIGLLPHVSTLPDVLMSLAGPRSDSSSNDSRPARIKLLSHVLDRLKERLIRVDEDRKLADRFVSDLKQSVNELLVKSVIPLLPHFSHAYRSCRPFSNDESPSVCFELLSVDVLFDSHYRPWFLDFDCVNLTYPSSSDSAFGVKAGESIADNLHLQLAEDVLRLSAHSISQALVQAELNSRLRSLDESRDSEVQKLIKKKEKKKPSEEQHQKKKEYVQLHSKDEDDKTKSAKERKKSEVLALLTLKEVRNLEKQLLLEQAERRKSLPRTGFVEIYPPELPQAPKKPDPNKDYRERRSQSVIETRSYSESAREQEFQKAVKLYEAQVAEYTKKKDQLMKLWGRYSELLVTSFTIHAKTPMSEKELQKLKPTESDEAKLAVMSEAEKVLFRLRKNATTYCEQLFELHDALMRERVPVPRALEKAVQLQSERIRSQWAQHQKELLSFWLLTLTQAKRQKVAELVKQPVSSLLSRIWRTEQVDSLRLFRILQRVLTKLVSNNGNFLFQCVKVAAGEQPLELKDDLKAVYSVAAIERDVVMQEVAELSKISQEQRDQLLCSTIRNTESMILRHFVAYVLDAVVTVYCIHCAKEQEKKAQSGQLDEKVAVHGFDKASGNPERYYCISIVKRA